MGFSILLDDNIAVLTQNLLAATMPFVSFAGKALAVRKEELSLQLEPVDRH